MGSPSSKTLVLIAVFSLTYLYVILRKTAQRRLDVYDLFMLSMVAVVPAAFAFFPSLAEKAAKVAGVAFPFLVMFGVLFAVLFTFIHRMTVKIHKAEMDIRLLVQELSLLREELRSRDSTERSSL